MRNKNRKRNNKLNKINKLLELPEEVITDKPKLTIVGFEEVLIEN